MAHQWWPRQASSSVLASTLASSSLEVLSQHHQKQKSSSSSSHFCRAEHDAFSMSLSIFLCVGLVISYLPQIVRIITKKSSLGFSPWYLLLGTTSAASSFLNVVSLQWGVVRCCRYLSAGQCTESLLGVIQVGTQWLLFVSIFVLFLIYYPKEYRYERAIALPSRNMARAAAQGADSTAVEEEEDDDDDDDSIGDIDSIGSHVVNNYSALDANESGFGESSIAGSPGQSNWTGYGDDSPDTSAIASRFAGPGDNADDDVSSSAFQRLVPSFWPVWKAPARKHPGPSRLGPGVLPATGPVPEVGLPPSNGVGSGPHALPANATTAAKVGFAPDTRRASRSALLDVPRGLRKRRKLKHKTPEWSLALALSWVAVLHFLFILLGTLLLISSLPASAFPSPHDVILPIPRPSNRKTVSSEEDLIFTTFGPSSRLLVSRWAAFLGITSTLLAAAQYIPQIMHTYRNKTVGSLSIPTMCLQVPGTAVFVYSLAIRPGIEWTSLAAYICSGALQLLLLLLCIAWKRRQSKMGVDDFGRPVPTTATTTTTTAESAGPVAEGSQGQ